MVRGEKIKMKITFRMWIMFICLALALIAIFSIPPKVLDSGVLVKSVEKDSSIFEAGLRQGDVITSMNGKAVSNFEDFSKIAEEFKNSFLQENETQKLILNTKNKEIINLFNKNVLDQFQVESIPNTNLKTGLDIRGGVRAIITAENTTLTDSQLDDLISVSQERLNVYGLSDLDIRKQTDLSGNKFMVVSIAGSSPSELDSLLAQQGKFEAKIGNITVFSGGDKDITSVCRTDAKCALIESCQKSAQGYFCNFRFSIYLSEAAAGRHAEITKNIPVNNSASGNYLSEKLDLLVDGNILDSLLISSDLKGRVTTQIAISGSGTGATEQDAYVSAKEQMKKLQTILITGSLPFKLKIEKIDRISPTLGQNFSKIIFIAAILATLSVFLIVYLRYRKLKLSLAMIGVVVTEVVITLGIASIIKWNIDLASIAGIIAAIGTGVDDQIVIVDESSRSIAQSVKQRIKNALFIIFTAYATAVVSLLPLYWAGAGLLKGFAVTSIIGITAGVLITRPAFADLAKQLEEKQ